MKLRSILILSLLAAPAALIAAQDSPRVLEEIIVRVNNEIITTSELARARASIKDEAPEACRNCTPQELQAYIAQREKTILRDLVDTSLLVQRCKDLGLNVEADVTKRLDAIRIQNNLPDMEALEKAVNNSGLNFEDFKNEIRRGLCTQLVIRREVSPDIKIPRAEIEKYYEEHKDEFHRPEMVLLSEFFLANSGKSEEENAEIEKKAVAYLERIRNGEDFNVMASRYSEGSTSKEGGGLGEFKRGQLAKELEDVVFNLKKNQMTDVIRTQTGFLILRVDERYEEGIQPLEKVENFITNTLYQKRIQPAVRAYLDRIRTESYVQVKPGFEDQAGVSSAIIKEVEPVTEDDKEKKKLEKKEEEERKDREKEEKKQREKEEKEKKKEKAPANPSS